ncbi:MAG: type III-B CRISPR module RAMP protein Cmr6 [Synergistaceae bacterium]|nr:type III-B CRISPR module RAMP protein Cmr6 [Synergistaceae bacterium]
MPGCRSVLEGLKLETGENASLIMTRYIKNLDDKNESKHALFSAMPQAAMNAMDLYSQAFRMRHDALAAAAAPGYFTTIQPLVVGLGNSNVIESGLALNPVYGMPVLPGSSLKGITAHYCSEIFGLDDPDYRGPNPDAPLEPAGRIYEALFGKIAPEKEQEAGLLRFYDAWIMPESVSECFVTDVMTPHHGSDFADPTPINFMTVSGKFELWIGCGNLEADRGWVDFAFSLTEAALSSYGIGGKIRSGYGKMERVLLPEEIQRRAREKKRAENIASGYMFSEGDEVEAVCVKVKVHRGKEKREFAFRNGSGDKNAVRFEPAPKTGEGDSLMARIVRIDSKNKAYILQAL